MEGRKILRAKNVIKRASNEGKKEGAIPLQYGALPYRFTETGSLELLLITTRQSGRWIIPKGWPIEGLKPHKSAAREAFEEAGVRGVVGSKPIGRFSYDKRLEQTGLIVPCEVRVFPMKFKRQLDTWPEAHERQARWFDADKSIALIEDLGLRKLILSFIGRSARNRKN